jgi:hypothetical protein
VALIKCPECGREVSDQAPACVGCGVPLTSASHAAPSPPPHVAPVAVTRRGGKWEALGTVLVIAGVLSAMFASPPVSTLGALAFVVGLIVFVIGRFQ